MYPESPESAVASSRRSTPRRVGRVVARSALGLVAALLLANLAILGTSLALQAAAADPAITAEGVHNLRVVDDRVLRGAAPSASGYRTLAGQGVATVIDLRAEEDLDVPVALLDELGVELVSLPIRDGQTPTEDQVRAVLDAVERADGLVYLHCGAGVGRTGAMAAAYLVATGQRSRAQVLRANLAVGPPTVEQLFYASFLHTDDFEQPPVFVTATSRFLDAPRRLWSRYGF